MERDNLPEDIMELTEKDKDTDDDTPHAAQVLAEETGRPEAEFTPDTDEYPHPHPNEVMVRDLRDNE